MLRRLLFGLYVCLLSILYLCLISKKPSVMNLQFEFCPPLGAPRGGAKKFFALRANLAPPYIYFCIRPCTCVKNVSPCSVDVASITKESLRHFSH